MDIFCLFVLYMFRCLYFQIVNDERGSGSTKYRAAVAGKFVVGRQETFVAVWQPLQQPIDHYTTPCPKSSDTPADNSGVIADPADPAMRRGPPDLGNPKIVLFSIFSECKIRNLMSANEVLER